MKSAVISTNQTQRVVTALYSSAVFLTFFLLTTAASTATHPVPLDKNTDSAKCIECHENKSKGKAVHSAIAMGCMSCHEIRVNRDVTRVKLITSTTSGLCLTCHADKNAAEIKGRVHSPAVRDCLKCHDPHTADNKNQLLKATSGSEKENLCLSCHKTGLNVPEKGSRHAALDMGCETCHVTHKTGAELTLDNRFHLTKAAPALCIDCHDPKDANLQTAHRNQPFGSANCISCHDPHQSASPKLMQAFTHPPFADKSCEMCHAPAKDGKVVLTQKDIKGLCVTCHDEQAKQIESALASRGVQADSVKQLIDDSVAQDRAFNRMFQAFMALGLFVGIISLGVIAFRSVVERRQQIGMLRAIGFQSRTVALTFVLESSFIALMGILSGVVGGTILARNLMTSSSAAK